MSETKEVNLLAETLKSSTAGGGCRPQSNWICGSRKPGGPVGLSPGKLVISTPCSWALSLCVGQLLGSHFPLDVPSSITQPLADQQGSSPGFLSHLEVLNLVCSKQFLSQDCDMPALWCWGEQPFAHDPSLGSITAGQHNSVTCDRQVWCRPDMMVSAMTLWNLSTSLIAFWVLNQLTFGGTALSWGTETCRKCTSLSFD